MRNCTLGTVVDRRIFHAVQKPSALVPDPDGCRTCGRFLPRRAVSAEGSPPAPTANVGDAGLPSDIPPDILGSLPEDATLDPATGIFTWIPAHGEALRLVVVGTDDGTGGLGLSVCRHGHAQRHCKRATRHFSDIGPDRG